MNRNLFSYIFFNTQKQQLYLSAIIWCYYPVYLLSLELPKRIINLIKDDSTADQMHVFEISMAGMVMPIELSQLSLIISFSFAYLGIVMLNGGFKFYINVYKGQLGERLLRRLRYQLYNCIMRFPIRHFRNIRQGEMIPIITAEVEPVGGFAGTAYADPQFQGGTLFIALGYIVWQDPFLGAAALSLYPVQMYLIPKLQAAVNKLAKERVRNVRTMASEIDDGMTRIIDIRSQNTVRYELARMTRRLATIYNIRLNIYRKKFFIKFLNNFIDKLTPFFFFLLGGYLVLKGQLDIGSLVAVLSAYKDLGAPWKELLRWYQQKEDIRVKFEQVIDQFVPEEMTDEELQLTPPNQASLLAGSWRFNNLTLRDSNQDQPVFNDLSLNIDKGKSGLIYYDLPQGRADLGLIGAGIMNSDQGSVTIGNDNLHSISEPTLANSIAFVEDTGVLSDDNIYANIQYSLFRVPEVEVDDESKHEDDANFILEAIASGNRPDKFESKWSTTLTQKNAEIDNTIIEVARLCALEADLFSFGLRNKPQENAGKAFLQNLLNARARANELLRLEDGRHLIVAFNLLEYNEQASVAENLFFGACNDKLLLDVYKPADNAYVFETIQACDLDLTLVEIGAQASELMVELFGGANTPSSKFQAFNLIPLDELEYYADLANKIKNKEPLTHEQNIQLINVAMRLIPAEHRLGLINDQVQEKILKARKYFHRNIEKSENAKILRGSFYIFDKTKINPAISVQDNVLFGKLMRSLPNATNMMQQLLVNLFDELGMKDNIIKAGLLQPVGFKGNYLNATVQQKILLARAVIKDSNYMLLRDPLTAVDMVERIKILANVLAWRSDKTTLLIANELYEDIAFDMRWKLKDKGVGLAVI